MAAIDEVNAAEMKKSLVKLMMLHTGQNVESAIDDILVTYLLAMVDPQSLEDDFDIVSLREMLAAYIPAVAKLSDKDLVQWVNSMSSNMPRSCSTSAASSSPTRASLTCQTQQNSDTEDLSKPSLEQLHISPKGRKDSAVNQGGRPCHPELNHTPEAEMRAKGKIDETQMDEVALNALAEMFPHKNALRIRKSFLIANGNVDAAVQLLLQDDGITMGRDELLLLSSTQMTSGQKSHVDEKTLREQIINRYAYVDVDEGKREHKPAVPKAEPKKLIRYRDNKVVSVKGERFTIEKKSQDTEN